MSKVMRRMGALLLSVCLMVAFAGQAQASEQAKREFKVNITWVNAPSDKGLAYDYPFVEKQTLERYELHVDHAQHALPSVDKRILKAQAAIQLPVRNSERNPAIYLLSREGLGSVEVGGHVIPSAPPSPRILA